MTILLVSLVLAALMPLASGQERKITLRVMTFNLRYASDRPPNAWPDRRPVVKNAILESAPDVVGTQEGIYSQLRDMAADLPAYDWIGEGREGGSGGEFMAVFYLRDRLEPLAYGHLWLSDTPMTIASRSWGNRLPRMVTWVLFRDRSTGGEFYVWNTHFDHQSQPSREKSAAFLVSEIRGKDPRRPVIVTGDFNQSQEDVVHATMVAGTAGEPILRDAWEAAEKRLGKQVGTWNGWEGENDSQRRIDWILISEDIRCASAEVVVYREGSQWPSDHFPVAADLEVPVVP